VSEFKARIDAGEKIEAGEWMPDEYRLAAMKFIEMHANSEVMGALPEREWIPRAPTLKRKLSLTAKVQDEVGHGQILYRVAEDLGKSREQMFDDLVNGRTKFHNVFHYPTYTWGDVAVIGWLIDSAALVTQKALLESSYAPYVRAMRRICAEESLHLRHGEDITLELVSGSEAQRQMFQEAVNRWWQPIMHFYGPPGGSGTARPCGTSTRGSGRRSPASRPLRSRARACSCGTCWGGARKGASSRWWAGSRPRTPTWPCCWPERPTSATRREWSTR